MSDASREFLQSALDALSANIAVLDERGIIVAVNEAWRRFGEANGLALPAAGVGADYFGSGRGASAPEAVKVFEGVRAIGAREAGEVCVEYPCHSPREMRWFMARITRFASTGPVRVVIAHENITIRKLAEIALARSERNFRAQIEASPDLILVTREGRTVYANAAAAALLGYASADDLLGVMVFDFLPPEEHEAVRERIALALRTGMPSPIREMTFVRRDSVRVAVEIASRPIIFDGFPCVMAVARDVTERKDLQARLVLADRMASIGMLASGVAHEINNPLAFVLANLVYLTEEFAVLSSGSLSGEAREEFRRTLVETQEGAERVRRIARDLKTLARGEGEPKARVDLRSIARSSVSVVANEIHKKGRLVEIYGEVPRVLAEEGRLGQVVLNLVVNAAQAIPEGNVQGNEITVITRTDETGRAILEVRDTGAGIAPEFRSRIFNPFFTTKKVGVGTGLGLSICHGIVTALGGEISFETEVGKGSAFRVAIPPSVGDTAGAPAQAAPAKPLAADAPALHVSAPRGPPRHTSNELTPASARRRVLVIDHEPLMQRALSRLLSHDCDVELEESGSKALGRLLDGADVDLILCELTMPRMDGRVLFEAVEAKRPDIAARFLFLSGGAFTSENAQFVTRMKDRMVEKPFDGPALVKRIQESIDGAHPDSAVLCVPAEPKGLDR